MPYTKEHTINGLQVYRRHGLYNTDYVVFWDDYRMNRIEKGISFTRESFQKWCRRNYVTPLWGSAPVPEPEYDDIVEEEFSKVLFLT